MGNEKDQQNITTKTTSENVTKSSIKTNSKNSNGVSEKLAVILVRGLVTLSQPIKDTLKMLNLTTKNQCVVIENNPINLGMIKKVKDFVTWGNITESTFKKLVDKRGKEYKGRLTDSKKKYTYKTLKVNGKNYKRYFTLDSPRKGFGRKGLKLNFKLGGALGNRNEKINDLIERMI